MVWPAYTKEFMATQIDIRFTWENNNEFEVLSKEGSQDTVTLVRMEENGNISALWPAATDLIERHFKSLMARIGSEMAQA